MGSLIRRWVALAPLGVLTVLTLFVALRSSSAATPNYTPTASFTSSSSTPGATADLTTQFDIPSPDPNFQAVISFTPPAYKVVNCTAQTAAPSCADQVVPDGTATGTIDASATLGTLNNACNTSLSVHFNLVDSTTNESVTTVYQDTDGSGHGQQFDAGPGGQPNGVTSYPDYLLRLARTQPFPAGVPLQPIQRLYGQTVVANADVGINFLVFAPGTTINGQPMDPIIGYPSFTLLNNTGDPQGVFAPSPITDFCTPLSSTTKTLGTSNGIALRTNPNSNSTQTFVIYTTSQPDADGDGIENALDPCPFNFDTWNPRAPDPTNDTDGDGIPNTCDPTTSPGNSDEDGDGYSNRGDNCPLVANGLNEANTSGVGNQIDTDQDGIGDACDPHPNTIDGTQTHLCLSSDIVVGTGGPPSNPKAAPPCGTTASTGTPTPAPTASPTPSGSVTPTPSGSVTPTPSGSVTPTPTGTPTPVPTVTATAEPSSLKQGDFNCDGSLTFADGIVVLAAFAGEHPHQTAPCQPIGAHVGSNTFGDVDCNGVADAMDALLTIEKAAGLTVTHTGNCPDFGASLG